MIKKIAQIIVVILCLFLMNFQSASEENVLPFPPQLDSLINIQNKFGNDTDKVNLLNEIAWHYIVVNADSGLQYGHDALKLASSLRWEKGAADAYNNIGESLRFKGDFGNSLSNHKTALEIFESINDKHGIAHSLSQIGISYFSLSDLSISYQYFYKALSLYRELNEKNGIAKNLSYMGIIQSNLKEYELALEHFNNSKNIYKELNEQQKFAVQTANIGLVYYDLKEYHKALEFYEQALNLFDEVGDYFSKSIFLSNAGLVYIALSDYEKAELSFSEALKISTQLDDKEGIAYQYGNIGKLYLKKAEDKVLNQSGQITNGLISRSIEYLEKSIVLLTSLGENIERKEFLFSLSQAYKLKNNFQKAFEIFAEATQIKDSILTSESKKQIAELEIKQQLDIKEKELELLNAKNDYQRIITYSLIGFIGLVAFSAVIIFILYMRIKNDNRALNENIRIRKEVAESLRQNESELKKYHEHLEELVNERTEELEKEITERIDIANSLRKSQEKFSNLFETMPSGYYRSTPEGYYIDANPAFIKMLGYESLEELKSLYIPTDVYVNPHERVELTKSNPGFIEREETYRLKRKDGSIIWLEEFSRFIKDKNGNVIYNEGLCKDITDRKLAEEALRESEERFSKAFKSSPAPLVISEIETGKFIDVNEQWIQMLGYSLEENLGHTSKEIGIWDEPSDRDKAVELIKKDGHFKNLPIKFVTKSGEKRDAFWSAEIIFLYGKEVMLSLIYDYTEQKIIQEALLESQRLSAVGEMSSAIAHDFNNSLQSIYGNLELALLKMDNKNPIKKYLSTIKTAVSDAAVRVQLLQRFAGKSKSRHEYIHVDLNQVVKDVIVQTRPLWKDSVQKVGMVIRFETLYADIPGIFGNEGELRSAVYNLIKNSIEAMPRGGVIKIKTSCKDNKVYLKCIDTGTGIDEATKSRVFQPFFSTKGFDEAGRGMGMVNAYSIIKEHSGKLEIIKSQPGKGTEIQIVLPVSDIQEKTEVIEPKNSYVDITANILWVDDDNLIREVAAEMLEVLGHNGDVVGSGEEALIKLNENNYDLVVTDIGMPGMNGWELADKIKELYKGEIKVAVLTGWGDQIDDDEKQRHGVSFIIGKPFRIEQIKRLITEAVILGKDDR